MAAKFTPVFQQWQRVKQQHPDALLLFRMGDFYEMFGEDAEIGARALELTLTSRDSGGGRRIPMCGVPYHSVDKYLARLVEQGYKCAICEQVGDPKTSRGLMDRVVTRVLTPGTAVEDFLLQAKANNYLAAVARSPTNTKRFGLAWVDVSTGEFLCAELDSGEDGLLSELARLQPAELLLPQALAEGTALKERLESQLSTRLVVIPEQPRARTAEQVLRDHFRVASLRGFGIDDAPLAQEAAACALEYLLESRLDLAAHVRSLARYQPEQYMVLDAATQRNLELVRNIRDGSAEGTLLSLLDRTVTSMGGRLLRRWLLRPLRDLEEIAARHDAVEELLRDSFRRREVREALGKLRDIERLTSRVATQAANARDLAALGASLALVPQVKQALDGVRAPLLGQLAQRIDPVPEAAQLLQRAIVDDPPTSLREGGLIRSGYNAQLDDLREVARGGKKWIAELEQKERQRTGIKSLRVGYNSVFGYYIEVTHANRHMVPDHYIRKQTLRNAERYITPELKEWESKVLGAEERSCALEYELFCEVRQQVAGYAPRLLETARALAELDVLATLAEVAAVRGYVRPVVDDSDVIDIRQGRHPVVEAMLLDERFVPNDALLNCQSDQLLIVTGPNMAGKSTYLRQVALIVLLAQMGSFVPAESARIGVIDRIFTRVGAHDDLALGQSTFMVEMTEAANILHNATRDSLIILDEIGRGTSTFDGLAIAWAVAEYIHNVIGAKTLFATHYHQLNALEEQLPRVRNYRILVREEGERMVFIRRIVRGGTDRSYGIQVARLAGLPAGVIERAKQVLWSLEEEARAGRPAPSKVKPPPLDFSLGQLSLFGPAEPDPRLDYLKQIESLDINSLTPLAALNFLNELKQKLKQAKKPEEQ